MVVVPLLPPVPVSPLSWYPLLASSRADAARGGAAVVVVVGAAATRVLAKTAPRSLPPGVGLLETWLHLQEEKGNCITPRFILLKAMALHECYFCDN